MRGAIRQVFLNVNMGNRFDGLTGIASKAGIKLGDLQTWDYLIFVNTGRDKVAMLVGPQFGEKIKRQTMAYVRLAPGRKLNLLAIREIPRVFNGSALNYDAALEKAIDAALAKKGHRIVEAVV